MLIRIFSPITTITALSRNGIRQPQVKNASSSISPNRARISAASTAPLGAPMFTNDAVRPRLPSSEASTLSDAEPPQSPPTAMPWTSRKTISPTAPSDPAWE